MKTSILTSILAFMLVLIASVSAFDAGSLTVTPNPLNMAEDATGAVTISIINGDGTETLSFDFGTGLQNTASTLLSVNNNSWTMDVKPVQDVSGNNKNLIVTINGVEPETLVVNVAPVNDAPTVTSTAKTLAVEDTEYVYDVEATDVDSTALIYSLTDKPDGMTINSATGLITWMPENDQIGGRAVVVQVNDGALNATQSFTITTRPKKVCKYGEIGDLDLTVDDPDSNDEFMPGDVVEINANVENDGEDDLSVTLTALLYDLDEGKLMKSVKSDDTRVKDGEEENFDMELTIPTTDFDEDNDFMLYLVAAEDEDEQCIYESLPVDLQRDDDAVVVKSVKLTPEIAAPGSKVTAEITVENVGADDQDNVYIKLKSLGLFQTKETPSFDLEDYKNDDKSYTTTVTFDVPSDAQSQDYTLSAEVFFDGGAKSDAQTLTLTVTGKNVATQAANLPKLEASAETGLSVKASKQLAVPVVLKNTGSSKATFTVEVSSVDSWAKVITIEQPEQLNAGEQGHAYIYLEAKSDAAIGVHEFSLNIRNDAGLVATKKVGVAVEGQAQPAATEPATTGNKITGLFTAATSASQKAFWAVGAAVLVLVGLFFLRMLFKK